MNVRGPALSAEGSKKADPSPHGVRIFSIHTASQAMTATAIPINRLMRSESAKTSGSSSRLPREASSHTRHSHKIMSGIISHNNCG